MLRKPVLAGQSSQLLCSTVVSQPHPHTSQPQHGPRLRRRRAHTARSQVPENELYWPVPDRSLRPPSPYQIFDQKRGEPYSKARFYELVKMYHPDRMDHVEHTSRKCTRTVMLERYRLIVAANEILSDPAKRDAYDRFGHGWSNHLRDPESGAPFKYGTEGRWRKDGTASYQWPVDQDPMYNATWEDWERWYAKRFYDTKPKSKWSADFFTNGKVRGRPLYMNNYAFVSIILLLSALGGAGQATRANEQAKSRLERIKVMNEETGRTLMEVRSSTKARSDDGETKEARIRRWLQQHGNYNEGEFDARVLREGDAGLCAPNMTKDQDQLRFWQKPPED